MDNQIPSRIKLGIDNMIKKVLTFQKSQSIDFQYCRTMHYIILYNALYNISYSDNGSKKQTQKTFTLKPILNEYNYCLNDKRIKL